MLGVVLLFGTFGPDCYSNCCVTVYLRYREVYVTYVWCYNGLCDVWSNDIIVEINVCLGDVVVCTIWTYL